MTENKPIMIDGVDVSECKKLDREYAPNYPEIGGYDWFNDCKETSTPCQGRNCYYKQLQRKIQECDILENKYINLETDVINSLNRNILQYWCCDEDEECPSDSNIIPFMDYVISNYIDNVSLTIDNLEDENKKLKQECEELKKDIKDIANLLDLDTGEEYNFGNIEIAIKDLKQECERLKEQYCNGLDEYKLCRTLQNAMYYMDKSEQKLELIRKKVQAYIDDEADLTPERVIQIIDEVE